MNAIEYTDFLTHWGIKGQRWGVRRYQNEDGSLTKEGKKRYYKEHQSDFINKSIDYGDEYDATPEGKSKKAKYFDAQDNWDKEPDIKKDPKGYNEFWNNFYKIERDYLESRQKYEGKKLISEFGKENFALMVNGPNSDFGEKAVERALKAYTEAWERHAI